MYSILGWFQLLAHCEALLKMGASIVATDLSELLPHLEYNISLNASAGALPASCEIVSVMPELLMSCLKFSRCPLNMTR